MIEKSWGSPTVTKDGVSVAKEIELADPIEYMGAQMVKEVASKTTTVAVEIPREEFGRIYRRAWELGLKGCTVFRPNAISGAVLSGPEPRCERCETPAAVA